MQIIAVNAVSDDFGFITDPIHLKQKFLHKRGRRLLYVVRVEVTNPRTHFSDPRVTWESKEFYN